MAGVGPAAWSAIVACVLAGCEPTIAPSHGRGELKYGVRLLNASAISPSGEHWLEAVMIYTCQNWSVMADDQAKCLVGRVFASDMFSRRFVGPVSDFGCLEVYLEDGTRLEFSFSRGRWIEQPERRPIDVCADDPG